MKKYIIKVAVWIPVIVMAAFIFSFSSQNGKESGGLSRKAAEVIINAAESLHIVDSDSVDKEQLIEDIQYPVRKLAHMTEYGIFAALVYIALAADGLIWRFTGIATVAVGFLFACTDEFHQTFVPGRCGAFTDVLIDTAGCIVFAVICMAIDKRRKNVL